MVLETLNSRIKLVGVSEVMFCPTVMNSTVSAVKSVTEPQFGGRGQFDSG